MGDPLPDSRQCAQNALELDGPTTLLRRKLIAVNARDKHKNLHFNQGKNPPSGKLHRK